MRRAAPLLFALAVTAAVGCEADKFNRQAVSGTVSMDGKPIPYGNIEFVPAENQPTTVTLEIKDGKFGVVAAGGLAPGKYVVRVQGMDGPPPPPGDVPGVSAGPQPKSIVPDKYGAQSTETVGVQAGQKNEFTLALQK